MKQHIRVHDDHVVYQRLPGNPQRRNAAAMKLLVHEIGDVYPMALRANGSPDHLLLVSDHNRHVLDFDRGQGFQIAGQQGLPADLDQAFWFMLGHRPEAFADSCRKDNRLHARAAAPAMTSSNAPRKPSIWDSVRAPMLATRKTFDSSCP